MDNSFIKLYNSLDEANSLGFVKDAKLVYKNSIQLSPNEAYSQITNVSGGISFEGDYEVHIVDIFGNVLEDVTANFFIEEFTDYNGNTQLKIEIINIGTDYYGRAVNFRFTHTTSDAIYYTNAVLITNKNIERTVRYDYWNDETIDETDYSTAQYKQSIRLTTIYKNPVNNSENTEYYQISTGRNISTRYLEKLGHAYLVENMDLFTYSRLLKLFKVSNVYMDGVRVTDKPILGTGERFGNSTLITSNFDVYFNENDTYSYEYQIFEGLILTSKIPHGNYTLATLGEEIKATFNSDIIINTGTLSVYDENDNLVVTFTEADIDEYYTNGFLIENLLIHITTNGDYYILFDNGLISNTFGIDYEGISNPNVWTFSIVDGMFNSTKFDTTKFLTD